MSRKIAFRKKRNNRLGMLCVFFVVALLAAVIGIKSRELKADVAMYEEREESLQAQIDAEQKRAEELVEYEKYTKTTKYVEEVAKEKLGLVYDDEILFKSDTAK